MSDAPKKCPATRRRVAVIILIAGALSLTGCLDYDEEMWLNNDLSGEVQMTLSLSDKLSDPRLEANGVLSEERVRKDMEAAGGLKLKSFESFKENGKQVTRLRMAFTSVEKLSWLGSGNGSPAAILGTISVTKENGHPVMKRTLDSMTSSRPKGGGEELLTRGLGTLLMGNNYLVYTVHFPGELVNANSTQTDKQTNTVRWKFPLSQAMAEPVVMRVEWKGGGWTGWVIGGVLAVIVAGFVGSRLWGRSGSQN